MTAWFSSVAGLRLEMARPLATSSELQMGVDRRQAWTRHVGLRRAPRSSSTRTPELPSASAQVRMCPEIPAGRGRV
ncbi:MAG: hypothetical protein ACRDK2_01615 [Solirubrobacteraceae bacterium]